MNKYGIPVQSVAERHEVVLVLIVCSTLAVLLFFYLRHALRRGKVISMKRYTGPWEYDRDDNPFQYWMAMMFLGCFILPLLIFGAVLSAERLSVPHDALHQDALSKAPY